MLITIKGKTTVLLLDLEPGSVFYFPDTKREPHMRVDMDAPHALAYNAISLIDGKLKFVHPTYTVEIPKSAELILE